MGASFQMTTTLALGTGSPGPSTVARARGIGVGIEGQEEHLVFIEFDDFPQVALQAHAIDLLELAKEHRELPGLAVPFEQSMHAAEPAGVADIVADEVAAAHGAQRVSRKASFGTSPKHHAEMSRAWRWSMRR